MLHVLARIPFQVAPMETKKRGFILHEDSRVTYILVDWLKSRMRFVAKHGELPRSFILSSHAKGTLESLTKSASSVPVGLCGKFFSIASFAVIKDSDGKVTEDALSRGGECMV